MLCARGGHGNRGEMSAAQHWNQRLPCVKVLAWYDNEIGDVHRTIEVAPKVGASR